MTRKIVTIKVTCDDCNWASLDVAPISEASIERVLSERNWEMVNDPVTGERQDICPTCKEKRKNWCNKPATVRFFWPGKAPSYICDECVGKLVGVAGVFGLTLRMDDVTGQGYKCQQIHEKSG